MLLKVVNFVKTGWSYDELFIEHGCLLWISRLFIPAPGRETLLDELHECHPGIVRMKALARSSVWGQDLMQKLKSRFQFHSLSGTQQIATERKLAPMGMANKPWYRVYTDYAVQAQNKAGFKKTLGPGCIVSFHVTV